MGWGDLLAICRIPCICNLHTMQKEGDQNLSQINFLFSNWLEQFREHSRYHRVWHQSCMFCENILQCFPNFNFWFLNDGKRRLQVEGYHRTEHFPIKPLVEHNDLQVYASNPNCHAIYSCTSKYKEYIKNMTMQANYFLISCHECDYHFKSGEQFREHVNLDHLVTKRFYHNFVNSHQEETDFKCEHCAKT